MTSIQSLCFSQFFPIPCQIPKEIPYKWKKRAATATILCLTALLYYQYSRPNISKSKLQRERRQIKKIFKEKEKEISELKDANDALRQKIFKLQDHHNINLFDCQQQQSQTLALNNYLSMNEFCCFISKISKACSPGSVLNFKPTFDSEEKKYQASYLTNLLTHKWVDKNKNNLLHIATQLSHSPIVRGLLQNKFPVNLANNAGHTPLHLCIQAIGDTEDPKINCPHSYQIFCDLVKHKQTDVSLKDVSNCTPVNMIAKYGQACLLYKLLEHRSSREIALFDRDQEGKMALDYFIEHNHKMAAYTIKTTVEKIKKDTLLLIDGYCREQYSINSLPNAIQRIIYEKYFL
ncbi:MAG: ankyrin repeat domain-containing protein [Chlamydiota bacterium]